jgi:hypothetical protein
MPTAAWQAAAEGAYDGELPPHASVAVPMKGKGDVDVARF